MTTNYFKEANNLKDSILVGIDNLRADVDALVELLEKADGELDEANANLDTLQETLNILGEESAERQGNYNLDPKLEK